MHLAIRSKTKRLTDESCRYVLHVYKDNTTTTTETTKDKK